MPEKINIDNLELAKPHTIKKFDFIEKYVETWLHKLLQLRNCSGIVFIDCMCNSGLYRNENNEVVYGTPIRIARLINKEMGRPDYMHKNAWIYLNDLSPEKIDILKDYLPQGRSNCVIHTSFGDGNELLKKIGAQLRSNSSITYLLVYDPYQACLDWTAIRPFLKYWGEVIINHMLFDSTRAVSQVKRPDKIEKYEQTYLTSIEKLVNANCGREEYEQRIEDIIKEFHGINRKYYIASCPFYNRKNSVVYNLIHCTSNIAGFKLFKTTIWQTFEGKSSGKKTNADNSQLMFDFENDGGIVTQTDDGCYCVEDIAKYLHRFFQGQKDIPLEKVWAAIDEHPIFPSDGFKPRIKEALKDMYQDEVSKQSISFNS